MLNDDRMRNSRHCHSLIKGNGGEQRSRRDKQDSFPFPFLDLPHKMCRERHCCTPAAGTAGTRSLFVCIIDLNPAVGVDAADVIPSGSRQIPENLLPDFSEITFLPKSDRWRQITSLAAGAMAAPIFIESLMP